MATVPLSGTNIRLLSGIPFSNDYKHTRWFDTESAQTNYFTAKTVIHSMSESNFQRIEGKHFIAVNKTIDELWGTNYLMFQNASYNSKWFYAFVTKLEYVQKNTTYVHFEIDVFQTWKFEMNFKPSYVVREHCKLWNADGSPVINTVDEGLDYGSDYDTIRAQMYTPLNDILFLVIVSKSTLHIANGHPSAGHYKTSMNGGVQPLCVYIHPFSAAFGSSPKFWDGTSMKPIWGQGVDEDDNPIPIIIGYEPDETQLPSISNVLNQIYTSESAVNNVVSLYITEHVGIDWNYNGSRLTPNSSFFQTLKVVDIAGSSQKTIFVDQSLSYSETTINCKKKYLDFGAVYGSKITFPSDYDESKLLMFPYSLTILDDFKGNRVVLKNEYIASDTLSVDVMGSMGVSNKVSYSPKNYLNEKVSSPIDRTMIGIENGLIDQSPHDVPILTDMLAAYLQGNKNSMQNQINSVVFNGITDVVGSVVGGMGSTLARNPIGIVSSGVNMVKGGQNAVLQLQGIQAKIKDINNVPAQMAKMGSNTSFDYGNGYYGFWVISKTIKPEYRKKLTDFFKMYGYKMNEVKMPNFHTRQNWNYVQTNSCVIVGSFNHEDLQELKNVFDNGITLWHTDDVGNYALSNGVIA